MIDSCIWTLSQVVQVKKVRKKSFPRFLVVPVPSELLQATKPLAFVLLEVQLEILFRCMVRAQKVRVFGGTCPDFTCFRGSFTACEAASRQRLFLAANFKTRTSLTRILKNRNPSSVLRCQRPTLSRALQSCSVSAKKLPGSQLDAAWYTSVQSLQYTTCIPKMLLKALIQIPIFPLFELQFLKCPYSLGNGQMAFIKPFVSII